MCVYLRPHRSGSNRTLQSRLPRVRQPRLSPRGAVPSPGAAEGRAGAAPAFLGLFLYFDAIMMAGPGPGAVSPSNVETPAGAALLFSKALSNPEVAPLLQIGLPPAMHQHAACTEAKRCCSRIKLRSSLVGATLMRCICLNESLTKKISNDATDLCSHQNPGCNLPSS